MPCVCVPMTTSKVEVLSTSKVEVLSIQYCSTPVTLGTCTIIVEYVHEDIEPVNTVSMVLCRDTRRAVSGWRKEIADKYEQEELTYGTPGTSKYE